MKENLFTPLNFKSYPLRITNADKTNNYLVYDIIRKKNIVLTPEEWVRQHVIHYLITEKKIPSSLINVEKKIKVGAMDKRFDIVVYTPYKKTLIIVECKNPKISIDQKTFDQIAQYNRFLYATYLMVTNGLMHYFCQIDYENSLYTFLENLPDYEILKTI